MFIRYDDLIKTLSVDCGIDTVTRNYVLKRFYAEGPTFLTVTLPSFSASVVASLAHGRINDPERPETCFTGFGFMAGARFPRYFSGLRNMFSRSGRVKDFDPALLRSLRRFCEYFYKLATSFTDQQLEDACDAYIAEEKELSELSFDAGHIDALRKNLEHFYGLHDTVDSILHRFRPRLTSGSFVGSDRDFDIARHWAEFKLSFESIREIPASFAAYRWARKPYPGLKLKDWTFVDARANDGGPSPYKQGSSPSFRIADANYKDAPMTLRSFRISRANVCEILFVPKDSRGPRVISKEPLGALPFQMAYFDYMVSHLEKVTNNRINFRDQTINQELARRGSLGEGFDTYDLKSASDRVSIRVIRALFRNLPLRKFLELRSEVARLVRPSGKIEFVNLDKLAGMGSGLTFPTMALLIHLAVSSEIADYFRIPFKRAMSYVYVYGDDLIVDSRFSSAVSSALKKVGLKLNPKKCFDRGAFRESCGGDFYKGVSVAPIRLKLTAAGLGSIRPSFGTRVPKYRRVGISIDNSRALALLQLERHCRELVKAHYTLTSDFLYRKLESVLGFLPYVSGDSPVIGRYTNDSMDVVLSSATLTNPNNKGFVMHQSSPHFVNRFGRVVAGPSVPCRDIIPVAHTLPFMEVGVVPQRNELPDAFLRLGRSLDTSSTVNLSWLEGLITPQSCDGISIPYKIKFQRIEANLASRLG